LVNVGHQRAIAIGLCVASRDNNGDAVLIMVLFTTWSFILMLLNNRVQRLVVPILDYKPYVDYRQMLFGRRFPAPEDATTEEVAEKPVSVEGYGL
jgi:hypothetical protein